MNYLKYYISIGLLLVACIATSQLPSYVPTSSIEGFYSFSGNTLDNSGNGHNSSNYNVINTSDRFDNLMKALYFSGTDSEYLNYGDVDEYEPYIASLSFWIYPEDFGAMSSQEVKPIISKWSAATDVANSSYMIYMDGTNLCFVLSDGSTSDTLRADLTYISLNEWNHVVVTSNYGFIKFYINGSLVIDTSSPISSFNNTNSDFKVGGWYQDVNPSFSSFSGKIDDIGIWSRELDPCEVEALFSGTPCLTGNLNLIDLPEKKLVKIIDLMGRETNNFSQNPVIFIYNDGTRKQVMQMTNN